jgi:hypothetical protein
VFWGSKVEEKRWGVEGGKVAQWAMFWAGYCLLHCMLQRGTESLLCLQDFSKRDARKNRILESSVAKRLRRSLLTLFPCLPLFPLVMLHTVSC